MNMNNRMKIFFFILVFSFVCSSCEKDQDAMLTQLEVMTEQIAPSYTSAVLQCSFTTKATLHNVYVQYAKTQDFAEYEEREMLKADDIYMVMQCRTAILLLWLKILEHFKRCNHLYLL